MPDICKTTISDKQQNKLKKLMKALVEKNGTFVVSASIEEQNQSYLLGGVRFRKFAPEYVELTLTVRVSRKSFSNATNKSGYNA